jgi:hypothetical protein
MVPAGLMHWRWWSQDGLPLLQVVVVVALLLLMEMQLALLCCRCWLPR